MPTGELEVVSVPIGDLHQDPRNARRHDARNLATIRAYLKRFGQRKPVVARTGRHDHRRQRDLEGGPGAGVGVHLRQLDPVGRRSPDARLGIADNRSAELASWNDEALLEQVAELRDDFDIEGIGFTVADLAKIAARVDANVEAP